MSDVVRVDATHGLCLRRTSVVCPSAGYFLLRCLLPSVFHLCFHTASLKAFIKDFRGGSPLAVATLAIETATKDTGLMEDLMWVEAAVVATRIKDLCS